MMDTLKRTRKTTMVSTSRRKRTQKKIERSASKSYNCKEIAFFILTSCTFKMITLWTQAKATMFMLDKLRNLARCPWFRLGFHWCRTLNLGGNPRLTKTFLQSHFASVCSAIIWSFSTIKKYSMSGPGSPTLTKCTCSMPISKLKSQPRMMVKKCNRKAQMVRLPWLTVSRSQNITRLTSTTMKRLLPIFWSRYQMTILSWTKTWVFSSPPKLTGSSHNQLKMTKRYRRS